MFYTDESLKNDNATASSIFIALKTQMLEQMQLVTKAKILNTQNRALNYN